MKRRMAAALAVLVTAVLVTAAPALAAPGLGMTAQRDQAELHRNDEFLSYTVKVKNIGADPTTAPTTLSVALPAGLKLSSGVGSGWSCDLNTQICTSAATIAANGEFSTLKLGIWVIPAQAPAEVTVNFTAHGGGAPADGLAGDTFAFTPAVPFGFTSFTARAEDRLGSDYAVAGGHPFAATSTFDLATRKDPGNTNRAAEDLRDLHFELPAGFIGNPQAASGACTVAEVGAYTCPAAAAVGGVALKLDILADVAGARRPLYKIIPEEGYAAAFAFTPADPQVSSLTVVLRAKLRSNGDYGVTAVAPLAPQSPKISKAEFATLCGFGAKLSAALPGEAAVYEGCKESTDAGAFKIPFLTNPTRCGGPAPVTRARIDSWQNPAAFDAEGFADLSDPDWKSYGAVAPATTDCEPLTAAWVDPETGPSFSFQPDTGQAAAPAAYTAHLHFSQEGLLEADGLASAHLKDTTVTLPKGLALNPAAAAGLGACSEAQVGLVGTDFPAPNPIHFSTTSEGCPGNSKIGNVEVETPLLDKVLHGSVYLAAQDANPFGSRFAIYLVIEDDETGTHATLAGKVEPSNSEEGRITATFENNPQVPIEDVDIEFFGGPRASLANPDVCGTYSVETALTPWSAVDPDNPSGSETATPHETVAVTSGPGGGGCAASKAARPFNLGFEAGSTNPVAGATSPFTLHLTRPDGNQEIGKVEVVTPPGFAAVLKGVGICSAAAIAAAEAPGRSGAAELATPSCPAQSQIGTTTIGAGAGPSPYYVKTGKVYLTGPYKGAPVSLAFVVPAVAGPFDLGVQVVKTALHVDPKTAQVTAKSDPIPQILDGVPLQVRDIRVDLDRSSFALNPTSCEAMAIGAQVTGASGAVAELSNRFQVGECDKLGFKPNLAIRLRGGTKRGAYQRLSATVTARPGEANIARAAVTFPHSAFLAQEHIRTVCTRVQFAARACPAGSVYGHAEAITPLLDQPLSGPVYLRSSNNPLPDLVAALKGPESQPIEVELSGRTDSKNGGIRNTFDLVPDAPVSKFTLNLLGGKKSLIVNSRNLCRGVQRATVQLTAQNGKARDFRPVVMNDCRKGKKRAK